MLSFGSEKKRILRSKRIFALALRMSFSPCNSQAEALCRPVLVSPVRAALSPCPATGIAALSARRPLALDGFAAVASRSAVAGDLWEESSLLLLAPFLAWAKRMHSHAPPCTSVSRIVAVAGNLASLCVIPGARAQLHRACSRRRGGRGCRNFQSLCCRARHSIGQLGGFAGRANFEHLSKSRRRGGST